MKGKWFLAYTWRDTFGSLAGTTEHEEIPLDAAAEDEAVAEAKEIWEKKIAKARAYWEKQKKEWTSPPTDPFKDGPHTPRVIYKIPL